MNFLEELAKEWYEHHLQESAVREYSLEQLLAGITPSNLHGESDWGPRRGREAW
ncbi:MAG: hypothetical protein ACHQZS_03250 [Candidatus Binatales bacterium]